jgi:hypothetical protein
MAELSSETLKILQPLKISAPQLLKGGERITIKLFKYPAHDIQLDSENTSILSGWKE